MSSIVTLCYLQLFCIVQIPTPHLFRHFQKLHEVLAQGKFGLWLPLVVCQTPAGCKDGKRHTWKEMKRVMNTHQGKLGCIVLNNAEISLYVFIYIYTCIPVYIYIYMYIYLYILCVCIYLFLYSFMNLPYVGLQLVSFFLVLWFLGICWVHFPRNLQHFGPGSCYFNRIADLCRVSCFFRRDFKIYIRIHLRLVSV